ncbi:hypothetical protein L3Q82_010000 [Scortum barcoo]|uniref:Uncharacterized protein n=1 Tax=Scortum barcoo TaxID=214431 RepID=A0ACB8WHL9_9TELE|nr:hypothetical protein L3Q82_010000 [Scortum barcoo]
MEVVGQCLWSGKLGWWSLFLKRGTGEQCIPTTGDHTSQPPREVLRQGTGEENSADSRPSDSGGTMRIFVPVVVANTGPALYPPPGAGGFMGVCPTSPHVLCGSGEGIRLCPSWYSVGGAPRVWGPGPLLRAVRPGPSACAGVRFAAECEAAGMGISTSKSEAMVLDRKRVACPLRVSGEVLPQVEEFKYLGVLFTSEGKMEREIDRQIGAASAVMRSVYRTVVVKKELSR